MRPRSGLPILLACLAAQTACFGAAIQQQSYYVLHGPPLDSPPADPIPGLVRVRNLDTASAYDKFQIVVRRSPFELRYAGNDVWAVKPNRMLSDIIARTLADSKTFESVTRELGETRPSLTLDGDLHAIEVYDSGDLWFAHLSFSLRLTSFDTGAVLWTYSFDQRKEVATRTFSHAARALSELLSGGLVEVIDALEPFRKSRPASQEPREGEAESAPPPQKAKLPEPIIVPERRDGRPADPTKASDVAPAPPPE